MSFKMIVNFYIKLFEKVKPITFVAYVHDSHVAVKLKNMLKFFLTTAMIVYTTVLTLIVDLLLL